MLLVIDVGNSRVSCCLFCAAVAGNIISLPRMSNTVSTDAVAAVAAELAGNGSALTGAVLGSVVPELTDEMTAAFERKLGIRPLVLRADGALPLSLGYENPAELGPDRVANALAARELYGAPAVVVDFGTATTIEVVDRAGVFRGGVILPGIRTAYAELFARVAMFREQELAVPEKVIGCSTRAALQSGFYFGAVGSVREALRAVTRELGETPVTIATGGLAPLLAESGLFDEVSEELTLQGLRLYHEWNSRQ